MANFRANAEYLTYLAGLLIDSPEEAVRQVTELGDTVPWMNPLYATIAARSRLKFLARQASERRSSVLLWKQPRISKRQNQGVGPTPTKARSARTVHTLRLIRHGKPMPREVFDGLERDLGAVEFGRLRAWYEREATARSDLSRALLDAAAALSQATETRSMPPEIVVLGLEHSQGPRPEEGEQTAANGGMASFGEAALRQLADAILESQSGFIFLGGIPSDRSIEETRRALAQFAATFDLDLSWDDSGSGSWWGRFRVAARSRVNEGDLDMIKRAAEVQLLDRHESQSAMNYAAAVQHLAEAAAGSDHAYLHSKNVLFVKTILSDGRSVVASRVLSPAEIIEFESGELARTLADGDSAYLFVLTGNRSHQVIATERASDGPQAGEPN